MKLLILSNNPDRASFRQRIAVYVDTLKTNGIDCDITKLPGGLIARRKLFKLASDFDGVFLHKKGLNIFDAYYLKKNSKKIIFNFDDAVMYSDAHPQQYSASHFRPWRRSVKLADMVIVGSSYLAELARMFNQNVEILPIGLKIDDYKVENPKKSDDKIRLVWIGSESNLKYLGQIKPVIEAIGSRFPNVVLRIIGDKFFDMPGMPVEKLQWSDQTRVLGLVTSDIGLAPLPDNRFTRGKCSFKVLEYAAAGLPVVASPIGTNKDHIREGITGFLAENDDQWLEKISLLVKDRQLRQTMGRQGRDFAQQFDISVIGKRFCGIIRKCLADAG